MAAGDAKALHRARVAIKIYRYQLELAGSLGVIMRAGDLRTMRRLQKELGAVTDLELLRRELKRCARRHPGHGRAVAVIRGRLERERRRRYQRALAAAGRDAIVEHR
jgi:CHAD domain-containing protein